MTALELLAGKLTDAGITKEQRLAALEETGQLIQSYCHLSDIPPALYFTQANMAADLLRYEREAARVADAAGDTVQSIREGDTTVSFGKPEELGYTLAARRRMLDRLTLDYRAQLQAFRKVGWQ